MLTIALAKGRLADKATKILERAGVDCTELYHPSRKLILHTPDKQIRFILVKPSDVPTYVEYGVADIGIVGKDTLLEEGKYLYEMLDLKYSKCKMVVAGFPMNRDRLITHANTRVATKYPNIAREYFSQRGETIEIIKLNGSVELGPLIGLSDFIVDIVESGRTLKENGLEVLEEICHISARLVVNRVSLKTQNDIIKDLISRIHTALEEMEND
jgi:ATP phosphoribosyltransferase